MLQVLFSHKRDFLLRRLQDMGITVEHPPQGTFYCWCDISNLPAPLNNCWGFFRELLKEKVIVTPGVFFDVNPGSRRKFNSYDSFIRISYGPSFKEVQRGLEGMQRVIERQRLRREDEIGSPWAGGSQWLHWSYWIIVKMVTVLSIWKWPLHALCACFAILSTVTDCHVPAMEGSHRIERICAITSPTLVTCRDNPDVIPTTTTTTTTKSAPKTFKDEVRCSMFTDFFYHVACGMRHYMSSEFCWLFLALFIATKITTITKNMAQIPVASVAGNVARTWTPTAGANERKNSWQMTTTTRQALVIEIQAMKVPNFHQFLHFTTFLT